jgi:hypothetical protein
MNARTLWVDQNAPNASDTVAQGEDPAALGTEVHPFSTINAAAKVAQAGDTVYVMPGIYREHVAPVNSGKADAPVTYQAAPGHQVFVRGSEVWDPLWEPVEGAPSAELYEAYLDPDIFEPNVDTTNPNAPVLPNPYLTAVVIGRNLPSMPARPISAWTDITREWLATQAPGTRPLTLGQIFVNGEPLVECHTRDEVVRTPGTWMVNDEGDGILVHFMPSAQPLEERLVELTVRDRVFAPARRGLSFIIVRGFVFEHCANQGPFPQGGMLSFRGGNRWLVEDNVIRYAKTIGFDVGSETWDGKLLTRTVEEDQRLMIAHNNVIRGNVVTDNGLSGMAGWNCPKIVIENNRVERNNALGFRPLRIDHWVVWEEHAGIKLHKATNGLIKGNLVCNNDAHGIWIDNGFTDARITGNTVLGNAGAGIMMELGDGPALIDNNIVAFTRAYSQFYAGDGIYGHDASNITVAHNLCFANARYGIFFQRLTDRTVSKAPVQASHLSIRNNLLIDNGVAAVNFPGETDRSFDNVSDYNVIAGGNTRFMINGGKASDIIRQVNAQVLQKLENDESGAASREDYSGWSLKDGLTAQEWQMVSGNDTHSIFTHPDRLVLRENTREVEIMFSDKTGLPVVPAADAPDAFAGALPGGDQVLAGPWQALGLYDQRYVLWPLPVEK